MGNLLAKELKLSIHRFYFVVPFLTGLLFLIPQWVFFLALMYFFFISVPNIHSAFNTQNDNGFSIMMPVGKRDMVGARIAAISILELVHIAAGMFYALLNRVLYGQPNFALDLNMAFFGFSFLMFGLFNIIFFPMYYRTGYRFGPATIVATAAALVFATVVELVVIFIPAAAAVLEGPGREARIMQGIILLAGVAGFVVLNLAADRISVRRFESADL